MREWKGAWRELCTARLSSGEGCAVQDSDLNGIVDVRYTGGARMLLLIEIGAGRLKVKVPVLVSDLDLECKLWIKLRLAPMRCAARPQHWDALAAGFLGCTVVLIPSPCPQLGIVPEPRALLFPEREALISGSRAHSLQFDPSEHSPEVLVVDGRVDQIPVLMSPLFLLLKGLFS